MEKDYYLHRISYEGNVSYSLLDKGYLTLGWSDFADTDILAASREEGYPRFETIAEENGAGQKRSRWSMWYFARMNAGDIVIVPLYDGMFSAYEVQEPAKSIAELENELPIIDSAWDDHTLGWKDHRIVDESDGGRIIDLGFYIKVKRIGESVPRSYVTGRLISRMKIQSTCVSIDDLSEHVENAIKACETGKPVSLYEKSIEMIVPILKAQMIDVPDDIKFEKLIKWYLEKCGAETRIPAKNEPGKDNGADADIVADFKNLKHMVYVQAKHHTQETGAWAVHQIHEYFIQKAVQDPDYSCAKWVISTCDNFSEEALKAAKEYNVRLIDGDEFARMLLDVGMLKVDDAFSE